MNVRIGSLFTILSVVSLGAMSAQAAGSPGGAAEGAQDTAVAEALFQEGRRLPPETRVAEACRRFEECYRIQPLPGTLINLAACHEREGRVATAWGEFNQVLVQARTAGRADREEAAVDRIKAIEPTLPRAVVNVPQASRVPGLRVSRNGMPLGPGSWGVPLPVDPGEVIIRAEADGYEAWEQKIQVRLTERGAVTVPVLKATSKPVAAAVGVPVLGDSHEEKKDSAESFWSTRRQIGAVVGGLGVVGLGVGSYFGVNAFQKKNESTDAGWNGTQCVNQECVDRNEEAKKSATLSTVSIGAGAVLVAAGSVLLFTDWGRSAEKSPTASAGVKVRPYLSVGSLGLGGTF